MKNADAIEEIAQDLIGMPVQIFSPNREQGGHSTGRNNRLYQVVGSDNSSYALKKYATNNTGDSTRLDVEYEVLTFLNKLGFTNIPAPVARNRLLQCGVYRWIDGVAVKKVGKTQIDAVVAFLQQLYSLRENPESSQLPLAREGCLSGDEIVRQLFARYHNIMRQAPFHHKLADFMRNELDDLMTVVINNARKGYISEGMDFHVNLDKQYQTLSPSDFGFHNTVQSSDGEITFLDFEYFGWDDPVKLVSDFLLHPGMDNLDISFQAWQRFHKGTQKFFGADPNYGKRLNLLIPLYALRWALIVLNEFIPKNWERRKFAGEKRDQTEVLSEQLCKADNFIQRIRWSLISEEKDLKPNIFLNNFCNISGHQRH